MGSTPLHQDWALRMVTGHLSPGAVLGPSRVCVYLTVVWASLFLEHYDLEGPTGLYKAAGGS